jgi:hypothetical protein
LSNGNNNCTVAEKETVGKNETAQIQFWEKINIAQNVCPHIENLHQTNAAICFIEILA